FLKHDDTVCPGCSTGCNVSLSHYRQVELADYNGVAYRLRPRVNDEVNQAWMCDLGRPEYRKINDDRLERPVAHHVDVGWEGITTSLTKVLGPLLGKDGKVAAIAGYDCTNEEIWALRTLLAELFGTKKIALLSLRPDGREDDFLIDADKHANRQGTMLVAGKAIAADPVAYLADCEAVIVMGADPAGPHHDSELREAFAAVRHKIVLSANTNETTRAATIALPTGSFAEKDGTWVNRQGRVQRIFRIVRKRFDARPDLAALAFMARALGAEWPAEREDAAAVFGLLGQDNDRFAGLDHGSIGKTGRPLAGKQAATAHRGKA
ncbi:MAG: molybdopterin-dependent oxidoreductase, partial [Planctomycetes bacterium]|nr:molybdopterin-dependent oxidoreductase [Planctomycetota bacterium]